jgi:large subunit ribosomal protein L31
MKKDIHPKSRKVVFKDLASDFQMLVDSCVETAKEMKWEDGKTYPLYEVEISSGSHPFYTGNEKILDTAGRVEKFEAKRKAALERQEALKKAQESKKKVEEVFKGKKKDDKK